MCLPTLARWCTLDKAAVFFKAHSTWKAATSASFNTNVATADILEADNGSIVTNVKVSGSQMINSMLKWIWGYLPCTSRSMDGDTPSTVWLWNHKGLVYIYFEIIYTGKSNQRRCIKFMEGWVLLLQTWKINFTKICAFIHFLWQNAGCLSSRLTFAATCPYKWIVHS